MSLQGIAATETGCKDMDFAANRKVAVVTNFYLFLTKNDYCRIADPAP